MSKLKLLIKFLNIFYRIQKLEDSIESIESLVIQKESKYLEDKLINLVNRIDRTKP